MIFPKVWLRRASCLGLGTICSFASSVFFLHFNISPLEKLELRIQDALTGQPKEKLPPEIVLVSILGNTENPNPPELDFYQELVDVLLQEGQASTVVLNLPHSPPNTINILSLPENLKERFFKQRRSIEGPSIDNFYHEFDSQEENSKKINSEEENSQKENSKKKHLKLSSIKRPEWESSSYLVSPIQKLLTKHRKKIVLVSPVSTDHNLDYPPLPDYNDLLRFGGNPEQDFFISLPEAPVFFAEVLGFFTYKPGKERSRILAHPARQASLSGAFLWQDQEEKQFLDSAITLALDKFSDQKSHPKPNKHLHKLNSDHPIARVLSSFFNDSHLLNKIQIKFSEKFHLPKTVQIRFWQQNFPTITSESICSLEAKFNCTLTDENKQQLKNKIVLIGFTNEENPWSLSMNTPVGKLSAVEIQAHQLASLLTDNFYQVLDPSYIFVISVFGGVLVSLLITFCATKPHSLHKGKFILVCLGIIGGYGAISWICYEYGWMLFWVSPLLSWAITGILVGIWLTFRLKQDLIAKQHQEIKKLKFAEQEAALSHTRKLLHRIAADIHDQPLQELKVVMDRIEIFQLDHPSLDADPILDKLIDIGSQIRDQLTNIRTMADKLEVTPELHSGLHLGMQSHYQKLVESGELTLNVIDKIQSLKEPKYDSTWLAQREDVFLFFREAISNVIHHGQQPHGNATEVVISLSQKGSKCTLYIENDGLLGGNSSSKRPSGGYGTKIMETISQALPGGSWERVILEQGRIGVKLTWDLVSTSSGLS